MLLQFFQLKGVNILRDSKLDVLVGLGGGPAKGVGVERGALVLLTLELVQRVGEREGVLAGVDLAIVSGVGWDGVGAVHLLLQMVERLPRLQVRRGGTSWS